MGELGHKESWVPKKDAFELWCWRRLLRGPWTARILNLKEINPEYSFSSVQFSSVTRLCLILCNPMNCSTPGLPVPHQLPEFTQTHVHWVGDAIQPSHPLSSPSPLTFNLPASGSFPMSQLFSSGGQSIGASASASVPSMNIQGWFSLGLTDWISLLSKEL